jgi:hypothetical protein
VPEYAAGNMAKKEVASELEAQLIKNETDQNLFRGKISELTAKLRDCENEISLREKELAGIIMSTSWRFAAPLRYIKTLFIKMRSLFR